MNDALHKKIESLPIEVQEIMLAMSISTLSGLIIGALPMVGMAESHKIFLKRTLNANPDQRSFGALAGKIKFKPGFDDPIDGFEDYMP